MPDLLSTELQQLQQLRPNHHDRGMETLPCTGAAAAAGIQPVLAGSGGRSSCAGGCGSTDAALGCDALPQEPHEDLEAARRLLCLQVGEAQGSGCAYTHWNHGCHAA